MVKMIADNIGRIFAFTAVAFGIVALVLACVGIGTIRWNLQGDSNNINSASNFFSQCISTTGTSDLSTCTSRSGSNHPVCSNFATATAVSSQSDCNNRLQNASGLGIVGIILIAFGIVATIVMIFSLLPIAFLNLLPGALFFLACLFMLASMAESARYGNFNGSSANVFQAGHLFTMLSLFLSGTAGGRVFMASDTSS